MNNFELISQTTYTAEPHYIRRAYFLCMLKRDFKYFRNFNHVPSGSVKRQNKKSENLRLSNTPPCEKNIDH